MSGKRLLAVGLIFVATSAAWLVLGHTISARTALSKRTLGSDVDRMFGPRLIQPAPVLALPGADEAATERPPDESRIEVVLDHEMRYRGLIWFSVYRVAFDATYTFRGAGPESGTFRMSLPGEANIDDLRVEVGGESVPVASTSLRVPVAQAADAPAVVRVRYVTSGQDSWAYLPQTEGGLRSFDLRVRTSFEDVDYPANGLSPTTKAGPRSDGLPGAEASWSYAQMLPARNHTIGLVMPSRTGSGTLSARISTFAPVSLLFFFVVLVVIQVLRGWRLHPVNYVLVAAGFFAFHILLAYLVDHLPIHASFWIAAAASVLLVVSYLRLVLGAKAALLVAGGAQLVYLVFFSYAFFWHGWTGLTVVIGAVVTLFVIMQLTGRIDWEERLALRTAGPGAREAAAPPG